MNLNLLPAIQFPQNYTPPHSNPCYLWCCEQFSSSHLNNAMSLQDLKLTASATGLHPSLQNETRM